MWVFVSVCVCLYVCVYVCVCLDVVTALTADGLKFTHPLHHIGKTVNDLPLLVIDSFKHMYLWHHSPSTDLTWVLTCLSVCLSVCLYLWHHSPTTDLTSVLACLSVCLSVCVFVSLAPQPHHRPYISTRLLVWCMSVCLFVCLFVWLSVCISGITDVMPVLTYAFSLERSFHCTCVSVV